MYRFAKKYSLLVLLTAMVCLMLPFAQAGDTNQWDKDPIVTIRWGTEKPLTAGIDTADAGNMIWTPGESEYDGIFTVNVELEYFHPYEPGELRIELPNDIRSLTDASDPLDHALPAESAFEIKSTGLYGGETPKNITYIVNKAGLEGPGNFSVTLRYKRVTAKASYGVQVPLKATVVEYRGTADEVTSYSNTITLETRTFVRISADSFMKRIDSTGYPDRVPYGMRSWPAEALYGPEPETNGVEYFYVWWDLITYEHGNDVGYYYAITETPGSGGEIVAIRSTYNTPEGYYPRMNTAQFNEIFNQANQKINKRWPAAVLMRYPYSMLTVNGTESSATLTNSFSATLYRSDDTFIETRTASDSGTVRFTEDAYGGDSLEVGKSFSSHSSYENYGKGAASILMAGEDYGIKEEVNIPSAMTLFAKEQTKDAQGNYGQVAYTAALEDSTLHLVAGANSHLLQPGEYSIRKARFYVSHYVPSTAPHEPVQGTLEDELVDYTTNGPVLEYSLNGTTWVEATMTSQSIKQYTFPQGTVALRGSYSSKAAGVRLNLQIEQLELHSTDDVRTFLENNQTSRIDLQNTTAFSAYNADGELLPLPDGTAGYPVEKSALRELTFVNLKTRPQKSAKTAFDDKKLVDATTFTLTNHIYLEVDPKTPQESLQALADAGVFPQQKHGVFYDRMPVDFVIDTNTIAVTVNGVPAATTVSIDSSAREQMLKVEWQAPAEVPVKIFNDAVLTFKAYTDVHYVADHEVDYGHPQVNVPFNYFVHEALDGTLGSAFGDLPFPADPADVEQAFAGAVSTDAALSANRFNFSGTQVNLSPALESGESGARLRVKAAEDAIFSTDTSVLQDGTYQYRMQRLSDRTDIFINNIFLLNLEVVPGTHWQGTLESVDVSENIVENVDAKVYYATEVQSETALPDFTDTAVWETRPEGADLSDVKAVGVDLTKDMDGNSFALHGLGRSLTVYYNMKAPDNVLPYFELSNDPVAKSQGVFYYNNPIDDVLDRADAPQMRAEPTYSYGHSVITTVHFFKMPLTISKTTQFGAGSAQTPMNVWPDQALNYTLVVKNESETPQDAKEIVLIDTLPDHLALDAQQDIQFYFGSGTPAAIDPDAVQRVQLAQDGQKLTFTIDSLSQNETLTLIIPTIVTPDPQQTSRDIFNSALIETVQGEPQYIESNMTYHRLGGPVTLSINAKKLLNNAAPPAGQFTFVLEGADGQDSAANNAQGAVVFEKTYDKPGEHTFTLSEKNDAQEGVTYDDTVYEVYVMLYAFPGMQQMQYGAMIMKDGEPIEGEMVFANTKPVDPLPRPTPASMTSFVISAQKVLQGKTLAAGEFTFELRDSQGNVIDTAKNAADGRVTFGARRTGNAGTYLYTIAEVKGQDAGITYDASVWQVRAVVKEAGGKLTASLSYLKDGTPYETATFTNSYLLPATGDAAPATIAALLALSVLLWMYSRKRKAEA